MGVILLKIFISVSYIGMIIINFLANSIPFNNQNTGDISSKYPSFFTPAGFTFSCLIGGRPSAYHASTIFELWRQHHGFNQPRLATLQG